MRPAIERSQGGLGVGLALVKNLVELHDGSVDAFSEGLGKGAEFTVRLPLAVQSITGQPFTNGIRPPGRTTKPLRILVVDDNVDAADSLEQLLKRAGHAVRAMHGGLESVDAARNYKPDVMLLDIALPGLNGYQIAERLRSTPETKGIVLIATTGYGQDEDRQRAMQSGFDHHVTKPIDSHALGEILSAIADKTSSTTAPPLADTGPTSD